MIEFSSSIDVDIELLDVDIDGSIAWVEALGKAELLENSEVNKITFGLEAVKDAMKSELANGTFEFNRSLEDVHMTVESRLIELIGETGAKLHTGRSRNDQIALDERLYLLGAVDSMDHDLNKLQSEIVANSEKNIDTIMPSYTHLRQAQPVRAANGRTRRNLAGGVGRFDQEIRSHHDLRGTVQGVSRIRFAAQQVRIEPDLAALNLVGPVFERRLEYQRFTSPDIRIRTIQLYPHR